MLRSAIAKIPLFIALLGLASNSSALAEFDLEEASISDILDDFMKVSDADQVHEDGSLCADPYTDKYRLAFRRAIEQATKHRKPPQGFHGAAPDFAANCAVVSCGREK